MNRRKFLNAAAFNAIASIEVMFTPELGASADCVDGSLEALPAFVAAG